MANKKNRNALQAKHFLIQREKGWSILYALRGLVRRFLLYILLAICFFVLGNFQPYFKSLSLLFYGFLAGAFVRDIGWLILIKKSWLFTESVTDWEKVREIADDYQ